MAKRGYGFVKAAFAFFLLFGFWLLVTIPQSFEPGLFVVGAVLTLLVAVLTSGRYPQREWLLNPMRLFWLAVYIPYFLYLCIKANLDVAYRVIHPDVPIRPGIVKVKTTLRTNLAKTFLSDSITLTPGTLVVDIVGSDVYVHWINVCSDDPEEQTEMIVQPFEPMLKRIFE